MKEEDFNVIETVVIHIENYDNNGLTQLDWAKFVNDIKQLVNNHANEVHFFGGSSNWENRQSVCWIFTTDFVSELLQNIKPIHQIYKRGSIAVTIGNTRFV